MAFVFPGSAPRRKISDAERETSGSHEPPNPWLNLPSMTSTTLRHRHQPLSSVTNTPTMASINTSLATVAKVEAPKSNLPPRASLSLGMAGSTYQDPPPRLNQGPPPLLLVRYKFVLKSVNRQPSHLTIPQQVAPHPKALRVFGWRNLAERDEILGILRQFGEIASVSNFATQLVVKYATELEHGKTRCHGTFKLSNGTICGIEEVDDPAAGWQSMAPPETVSQEEGLSIFRGTLFSPRKIERVPRREYNICEKIMRWLLSMEDLE